MTIICIKRHKTYYDNYSHYDCFCYIKAIIAIIEAGVENEIYNISGGFEQSNLETVKKVIREYTDKDMTEENVKLFLDLSYSRAGQDVRYALNDNKLRSLGWKPEAEFDNELKHIVEYYKHKFIW
jgi:dTDP-D-glucose 4,6-dehydratase